MYLVKPKTLLGAFFRKRRMALGLTVKQLAAKVGLCVSGMNHYETGRVKGYRMSPDFVKRLARNLKCRVREIRELIPPKPPRDFKKLMSRMVPAPTKLGRLIRSLRTKLGLYQKEVAKRMGMKHYWPVLQLEAGGITTVTRNLAKRLVKALECDISRFKPFLTKGKTARWMRESKSRLGKSVRSRRIALNLSQEELGRRVGVSRAYISRIEIGLASLAQGNIIPRLAKPLGVRVRELRTLKEPRKIYKVTRPRKVTLGTFLTKRRIKRGLSQCEVARRTGLSGAIVNILERDLEERPCPRTLDKVAFVLGCRIPTRLLPKKPGTS